MDILGNIEQAAGDTAAADATVRDGGADAVADDAGVLVAIVSRKYPGLFARVDAADGARVAGMRWNFSPGKPGREIVAGAVVLAVGVSPKPSLARVILGIKDRDAQVSHRNGDKLDCRRANLVVRSRSEVSQGRKPSAETVARLTPYPDPERPGVWRVPLKSNVTRREALIDEADLAVVRGRNWNWSGRSDKAGAGVVVLASLTEQTPLHRLIANVTDPARRVSFANGDGLDCRRANLLVRTASEVNRAAAPPKHRAGTACSSAFKGVTFDPTRGKWVAQMRMPTGDEAKAQRGIGRFDDEIAAAHAYDDCVRVSFGDGAYVNFPDRVTNEPAATWARRVLDGSAVGERRRGFRRRRMEKKLRRVAREVRRKRRMAELAGADAWAGDDAWTRDPAVPKIARREARALFGVSKETWKRWLRVGYVTCGHVVGGRTVYPLAEIERLLQVCGRWRPPYADPERPGVVRVPLFGRGMRKTEALIDRSTLALIQNGRCTLGATSGRDRSHVAVWFPATKVHVPLRRLITGVTRGPEAKDNVQHRNGDFLDCRRENLVVRTAQERTHTSRKVRAVRGVKPSSQYKGVSWHAGAKKWMASITSNRKTKYLGVYEVEAEAAQAYDRAALMKFGPHAFFNFPREDRPLNLVQVQSAA